MLTLLLLFRISWHLETKEWFRCIPVMCELETQMENSKPMTPYQSGFRLGLVTEYHRDFLLSAYGCLIRLTSCQGLKFFPFVWLFLVPFTRFLLPVCHLTALSSLSLYTLLHWYAVHCSLLFFILLSSLVLILFTIWYFFSFVFLSLIFELAMWNCTFSFFSAEKELSLLRN